MNDIKSVEDCVNVISRVLSVLDQITVTGRQNCFIVAAAGNDLSSIKTFLENYQNK